MSESSTTSATESMIPRILAISVLILAFHTACSVHAITYKATLLNPTSGFNSTAAHSVFGNTQIGGGYGDATGGQSHALMWAGTSESVVDLHPSGFEWSEAYKVSDAVQVGQGGIKTLNQDVSHALLWRSTSASVVDLHPIHFYDSIAFGVSGNTQVGSGRLNEDSPYRALLWKGTADSVVDLHPAGYDRSDAIDISGNSQVGLGSGGNAAGNDFHALLWHGSADSVVDLHPVGFKNSIARGVSGLYQAGYGVGGTFGNAPHALLWSGTADSVVDLHPSGFRDSVAQAVFGGVQVGWGSRIGSADDQALVWTGTAENVLDLHPYLAQFPVVLIASRALGVDANGAIVGFAIDENYRTHAVLWIPIPEPASAPNICCGMIAASLCMRLRRATHRR